MTLLAVPNFSEGRDQLTIEAIAGAIASRATLLDVHSDRDHNRTVYTATGSPQELTDAVVEGARCAVAHIDMTTHRGVHPHIGALDVAPIVFLDPGDRGLAAATALLQADRLADELEIPVFLYGILTANRVTRAALRRGGPSSLASRIAASDATPDFGPHALHPRAGATLVAARAPLLAFNVELAPPASLAQAREIAAELRRLPGVTAMGVELSGPVAQVSMNLEDPDRTSPADAVAAIVTRAPVQAAEIVGLPPARYYADFPASIPLRNRRTLEERLLS
jgi:glutamate formiminotransferase / 5-formyltetrahydrofolate cyclo-ligase